MKTRLLTTAAGMLFLAGAVPAIAQESPQAKLTVAMSDEYGAYIADAEGRALYMFEADQRGEGDKAAVSNCYDACAQAWPPLLAEGDPAAGDKVDGSLIGKFERTDGKSQVSYGGWPLYYYEKDEGAGKTTGQDVEDFGAEWYLVSPSGEKVEE